VKSKKFSFESSDEDNDVSLRCTNNLTQPFNNYTNSAQKSNRQKKRRRVRIYESDDDKENSKIPKKTRKAPTCKKCRVHGKIIRLKGHKSNCEFEFCYCEKCVAIDKKRIKPSSDKDNVSFGEESDFSDDYQPQSIIQKVLQQNPELMDDNSVIRSGKTLSKRTFRGFLKYLVSICLNVQNHCGINFISEYRRYMKDVDEVIKTSLNYIVTFKWSENPKGRLNSRPVLLNEEIPLQKTRCYICSQKRMCRNQIKVIGPKYNHINFEEYEDSDICPEIFYKVGTECIRRAELYHEIFHLKKKWIDEISWCIKKEGLRSACNDIDFDNDICLSQLSSIIDDVYAKLNVKEKYEILINLKEQASKINGILEEERNWSSEY